MPENSTSTEVTAAGIARLAGVGRAAVSNWRRRHADFPKPVGGTETSPSFALPEVEQWLRDQGKLAEVPLRERVWQQLAGHPAGAVPALVHTGCALLLRRNSLTAWREIAAVSDEAMAGVLSLTLKDMLADRFGPATVAGRAVHTPGRAELLPSVPLLRGAAEMAAETGARETFEFLLGRQLDANPRQYTLTPPGLAELMAALVETGKQPARTVFDPAAGTGALLRAVDRPTALYAQEADPDLAALTALRLALHTDPDNSCTLAARAATPCAPTPSRSSPPTPCSATRRSTNATGATTSSRTTRAGSTGSRPVRSPNSPGSSTPWPICARAAPPYS